MAAEEHDGMARRDPPRPGWPGTHNPARRPAGARDVPRARWSASVRRDAAPSTQTIWPAYDRTPRRSRHAWPPAR